MSVSILQIAGIAITLALIIGVSLYSGKKVSGGADFATGGGGGGSLLVCGGIMGALVSSQATIGTAQLAFTYGLSAWWFTLGSGIGCLLLALFFADPIRKSGCTTEFEIIRREYGKQVETIGSGLCSIGIFISVLAQVVAGAGLVSVLFPSIGTAAAVAIMAVLMTVYVLFGGAIGAGMGGVLKLILLYIASIAGLVTVLHMTGGLSGLGTSLQSVLVGTDLGNVQSAVSLSNINTPADLASRFYSLTARGPLKDIGSGLSLLLGVLSTQTYAQAILTGKTNREAKKGAMLSACLIPPLGIAGIGIGLFMRTRYVTAAEATALAAAGKSIPAGMGTITSTIQVFPMFVVNHMPQFFGGIILGTLLVTIIGGGAGLSLGVATIAVRDIYTSISPKFQNPRVALNANRLTIIGVLALAALLGMAVPGATINDFGFLSMGLRGSVVFLPLVCALFLPGKIDRRAVLVSTVLGPVAVLAGNAVGLPFDPLFVGIAVCFVIHALGYRRKGVAVTTD